MRVFFDTSALTKRYVDEVGSEDLCDLSQEAFEQTIGCLERHPLRALDALHVGSALVYQPDFFVSADRRQAKAAGREGLSVVDLSQ
jgi:hypothetical protein